MSRDYCLICGKALSAGEKVELARDKTKSDTLYDEVVFKILNRKEMEDFLSDFLCRLCSRLISEFEEFDNKVIGRG